MDNFTVLLTNSSLNIMSPFESNYTLCGQWPGAALNGQTMVVVCTAEFSIARYVIIKNHQAFLTICEVQVFGIGMQF
jgi:hypothetical protein